MLDGKSLDLRKSEKEVFSRFFLSVIHFSDTKYHTSPFFSFPSITNAGGCGSMTSLLTFYRLAKLSYAIFIKSNGLKLIEAVFGYCFLSLLYLLINKLLFSYELSEKMLYE